MSELTREQIENGLKQYPQLVHNAGVKKVEALSRLNDATSKLNIEMAKVRIKYSEGEKLLAKLLESYAIVETEEYRKAVDQASKEVELAELEYELADNKLMNLKKICNLRNIDQM